MYYSFIKGFNKIYHADPSHFLDYVEENISFVKNPHECPTVGAFDGDQLVSTISAYYPPDGLVWYCLNQFSKVGTGSLADAIDNQTISMKAITMLTCQPEQEGRFNFFGRKSIRAHVLQQKISDRIGKNNYLRLRYDTFHDGFYPAGVSIDRSGHDFFKAHPLVDSVIYLHCLKQEERVKLLSEKNPEYAAEII
jgi:hypothetical protein